MKTTLVFLRNLASSAALVAVLSMGPAARAADPHLEMKGAQHLQCLNSPDQAKSLKPGDTVAMVCAMCKDVSVTRVDKQRGREVLTPGSRHECRMCGGSVEAVGQRIDKKDIVKHTCSKCGGESAFCCATRPGGGKTHGMEK